MKNNHYTWETQLLHINTDVGHKARNPEVPPIYHTTTYVMEDLDDYIHAGTGDKYRYARSGNPNRDIISSAVSALEHGENTLMCSSGMSAITTALLANLQKDDHILLNSALYGETIYFVQNFLAKFGVESSFVDFKNLDLVAKSIKENTKILYSEIISNPLTELIDLKKISKLAKAKNALVVIDNTFTTPMSIKPLDLGADIVVHSLTKFAGGHGDITAGSITASNALIAQMKRQYQLLGGCLDPNTSWMLHRSLTTFPLRMSRHFSNALLVAEALEKLPMVEKVYYPGLTSHPQHELAKEMLDNYGAVLSFKVADDFDKVNDFIHRLQFIAYLGTLGGARTSIAHPAVSYGNTFTKEELLTMGISDGLIRISIGIEDPKDIIADLTHGLEAFL